MELVGNKMEMAGQGLDCGIMILLTRDSAGNQHGREGSELPRFSKTHNLIGLNSYVPFPMSSREHWKVCCGVHL